MRCIIRTKEQVKVRPIISGKYGSIKLIRLVDYSIGIVLLAAGRGTRMGIGIHAGAGNPTKLLLPMRDGRPIVYHAAQNALALKPAELLVVVRPDLPGLSLALSELQVKCISNPRYMEGMGTSLAVGVSALTEGIEAALVMLGDEPGVPSYIIERLVAAYVREKKPITLPIYDGQAGPPTIFSREMFGELSRLEGDIGGRQLAARHPELICRVVFEAAERPGDVDTPEDYQAML